MRPFLAMIRANLKMVVRNRTALFWNLAFPGLFILIFGTVFGRDTGVEFDIGVTGESSAFQQETIAALKENDAFTVTTGTTEEELGKLEDGDRDVVADFGPTADGRLPTVTLHYDQTEGPNARIALTVVRQVLLTVAQGENPVPIEERAVTGEEITYIDFFVPGILAMALMNAGVIGLSTVFVSYRERGILRRIRVTPFPLSSFILARVVTQLIVAVAQALILVGMAWLIFDLQVRGNPLVILLVILVGSLAFLAIGFAIAGFARNVETAASYANLVTFPMLFLAGVFFDLDDAPSWLEPVTRILPLRYLVNALREPMTRGGGLGDIWLDLLLLAATFAVGFLIAIRFFKWEARGG